jgi:LPXTG-motif cell wall-anchored protein
MGTTGGTEHLGLFAGGIGVIAAGALLLGLRRQSLGL